MRNLQKCNSDFTKNHAYHMTLQLCCE